MVVQRHVDKNFHLALLLETDLHTVFCFFFRNNYDPNVGGKFAGVEVLFLSKMLSTLTIFKLGFLA